jgi:hypothetical protein
MMGHGCVQCFEHVAVIGNSRHESFRKRTPNKRRYLIHCAKSEMWEVILAITRGQQF